VLPREKVFLHGKAGVIDGPNGKTCFLGSINETKSAFATNYEILWEDPSPEGVAWVEQEFEALWADAFDLPDAIIEEIQRIADRIEIRFEEAGEDLPAASLAETPIYRNGEQLQPWQRSFVTTFLEHRETYGGVRLLLADEVGLGKTLSLATSAMIGALLGDGPVLILCPSTLTWQWQVELKDRLGIPSAVWHSNKKEWFDPDGHRIRTRGPEDIARCPFQIAIVSTGLIFHHTRERDFLLGRKYGTLVLDEAHKARRKGGLGNEADKPNNLLDFMLVAAAKARHILLGTATPIQTDVADLWDLLEILATGNDYVLGRSLVSKWVDPDSARPIVTGEEFPDDHAEAWELCRTPLPPGAEHTVFASLRASLDVADDAFYSNRGVGDLDYFAKTQLDQALEVGFFRQHNPILRHTVLRRRVALEDEGLLKRIAVDVHPDPDNPSKYPGLVFNGLGLRTNHPFDIAYAAAEASPTPSNSELAAPVSCVRCCCSVFVRALHLAGQRRRSSWRNRSLKTLTTTSSRSFKPPPTCRQRKPNRSGLSSTSFHGRKQETPNLRRFNISSNKIKPKDAVGSNSDASFSASTTIRRSGLPKNCLVGDPMSLWRSMLALGEACSFGKVSTFLSSVKISSQQCDNARSGWSSRPTRRVRALIFRRSVR
jgi:hypothetical protein